MSTTVFPFGAARQRPYREYQIHETKVRELNGGKEVRRAELGTYGRLRVSARLRFPITSYDIGDWLDFVQDRQGQADSFLYKCILARHYLSTDEALGTGNGSTTDFALDFRHVDAATLVVKKGGVTQGSGWSLVDNNTTPVVRFTAAPASGAITATYEYYYPVRFATDDLEPEDLHPVDQATGIWVVTAEMLEEDAGAHRA